MSMEYKICNLVKHYWNFLHPNSQCPDSLVFLKVAGKTSPNAAIIAMILDAHHRRPVAVAKIPRNPAMAPGLKCEFEAMVHLRESVSDTRILEHTSCRGNLVEYDGVPILLQAAGEGHPMVREMTSRKSVEAVYKQILPWMFDFHADSAENCVLEGETLHELVEEPIARFMKYFNDITAEFLSSEARQYLKELTRNIQGRKVRLCRQHGDFNAHNILVEYNRGRLCNFTLVDWEDYQKRRLPIHDLNHFFTSNSHLLSTNMPADESYAKVMMDDGWYRNLYTKATTDYESYGLIDRQTFWDLTPLYMIEMCFCISDVQRNQQDTAPPWIKRMNIFINRHLRDTT